MQHDVQNSFPRYSDTSKPENTIESMKKDKASKNGKNNDKPDQKEAPKPINYTVVTISAVVLFILVLIIVFLLWRKGNFAGIIDKPVSDMKDYQYFELGNRLKLLVINPNYQTDKIY